MMLLSFLDVLISGDYYSRCPMCWREDRIGYPRIDGAVCAKHIFVSPKEVEECYKEATK